MPWAQHIDLTAVLSLEDYYRTDTHWRQERILEAARTICEAMGTQPPRTEDFTVTELEQPFRGVYSGQAALLPAFAADRFGTKNAGINYGLLALGMSAGSLIFPPLARLLQGESAPHWIAAAAAVAGFICLWFYGKERSSPTG
jgi:hypothetical protein